MNISMETRLNAINQSIHYQCRMKGFTPAAAYSAELVAYKAYAEEQRSASFALILAMERAEELNKMDGFL